MKKLMLVLFAAVMFLTMAPVAMANHCTRCKPRSLPHTEPPSCLVNTKIGYEYCDPNYETDDCDVFEFCTHPSAAVPLATEYQVASVERLDAPQTGAAQTLVTSLPAPATR